MDHPENIQLQSVIQLAEACEYDMGHAHQVTRLALHLFDDLKKFHQLGPQERTWLQYAGILHDIGWVEGWREHHKVSLRIILTNQLINFSNKDRMIIGSIARYHRKALPDPKHDHYAALSAEEQHLVDLLAGVLRIADGLDRTHQKRIRDIRTKLTAKKVTITCFSYGACLEEQQSALEKSDLLEKTLGRKINFVWEEKP
jgi:exopolyphosphatase/pppGpp-phosphohydrolase